MTLRTILCYLVWLGIGAFFFKFNMMFFEERSYAIMFFTVGYGTFGLWLLRPWA